MIAGVLIMTASGSIYLTPCYSSALQSALDFSNTEISAVTTAVNVGTWLAVIPGFFFDV